jgi:hypothetical protein
MNRSALVFAAFLGLICAALGAQPWRYMPAVSDGYDQVEMVATAALGSPGVGEAP